MSEAGGFLKGMDFMCSNIVFAFSIVAIQTKMVYYIVKDMDFPLNNKKRPYLQNVVDINTFTYLFKQYILTFVCCKTELAKKICFRNKRFKELSEFHDYVYEDVIEEMTLGRYFNHMTQIAINTMNVEYNARKNVNNLKVGLDNVSKLINDVHE